ncbi:MAG: YeeE/YedE family protein [Tagaea sp.]|nr:YeeE/YedE family protein [Tagaea sp.]
MSPTLMLLGAGLGAAMAWGRIGFAGAFRARLESNDARGLAPLLVFLAASIVLHALAFATLGGGGFVAPAGIAVAFGAFVFGTGMQLANACGSGTLVALGSGSARMLAVLPFFVLGSFLGTLDAPAWDDAPALPAWSLGDAVGWAPAALIQLALLALLWFAFARDARFERTGALAALALAGLAVLVIPLAGHPWGITWGFALTGAKAALALGWDPAASAYWTQGWTAAALDAPLWRDTTVAMDAGLILGAGAMLVAAGRFGGFARPSAGEFLAAALGGLAMGYGARLSGGCNIGAFVGGVVSGSPHGWLWLAACLAGCKAGIGLRPFFGFARAP